MNEFSDWLVQQTTDIDANHLRRDRRVVRNLPDGLCEVNGRRLRNFASNDYLNLANDPAIILAANETTANFGLGSTASALVCGRSEWHERLESTIAKFESEEDAVLFPSGFAANLGTVSALTSPDDVLFCDRLNHACLIDGARLSKAKRVIYDASELDSLIATIQSTKVSGRRWIVTDAVFSMDGQLAPLAELVTIAEQYNATLIVDEAHGTGVFGENGRGACELTGIEGRENVIRTGTLSKAIGCMGGFVAGSKPLIDFLWHKARPQFFSTALPPSVCAAAVTAFNIVTDEPMRRSKLMDNSERLRKRLGELTTTEIELPDGIGPIVPVVLHDPVAATSLAHKLADDGFLLAAIRPPTVPEGTSRLRLSVTAAHSDDDIDQLVTSIAESLEGITR